MQKNVDKTLNTINIFQKSTDLKRLWRAKFKLEIISEKLQKEWGTLKQDFTKWEVKAIKES